MNKILLSLTILLITLALLTPDTRAATTLARGTTDNEHFGYKVYESNGHYWFRYNKLSLSKDVPIRVIIHKISNGKIKIVRDSKIYKKKSSYSYDLGTSSGTYMVTLRYKTTAKKFVDDHSKNFKVK